MLFKKAVITTDLHIGKKADDPLFLQDCREFIDWSIEEGKKFGADTYIHLGDWHDNRKSISINSLNVSIELLEKVAREFDNFFLVLGNHDLFYKEKRTLNSVEFAKNIPNLTLVKDPIITNSCSLFPWVLKEDIELLKNTKSKYIFGHFELAGFLTNQHTNMPDNNFLNKNIFHENVELVLSGHFHMRQEQTNSNNTKICYIGNCFPHNFSDANDKNRGLVLLEYGKELIYKNWENIPYYKSCKLSSFLEEISSGYEPKKLCVRAIVDIDIQYEKIGFLKDSLENYFQGIREIQFSFASDIENDPFIMHENNMKILSIDEIIDSGIKMIDSHNIDKNLLLEIYKMLQ